MSLAPAALELLSIHRTKTLARDNYKTIRRTERDFQALEKAHEELKSAIEGDDGDVVTKAFEHLAELKLKDTGHILKSLHDIEVIEHRFFKLLEEIGENLSSEIPEHQEMLGKINQVARDLNSMIIYQFQGEERIVAKGRLFQVLHRGSIEHDMIFFARKLRRLVPRTAKQGKQIVDDERSLSKEKYDALYKKMEAFVKSLDEEDKYMQQEVLDDLKVLGEEVEEWTKLKGTVENLIREYGFRSTVGHEIEKKLEEDRIKVASKLSEHIAQSRVLMGEVERVNVATNR